MLDVLILLVKYGFVAVLIVELALVVRALMRLARPAQPPTDTVPGEAR